MKIFYGKINAQLKHTGFRRWVHYVDKHMLAQELNATGPVTEEVFEANRLIRNLKDFMRTEAYPEEQIKRIVDEVNVKELQKIVWGVSRWKIASKPNSRLMIKVFDHWRLMIRFRKLMRHWLTFSNNRV